MRGAGDTVVQPDLIVVCDLVKLANHKNVQGARSGGGDAFPVDRRQGRTGEKALYGRAGVPQILAAEDSLVLNLLPGREFPLGELFDWPLPCLPGASR